MKKKGDQRFKHGWHLNPFTGKEEYCHSSYESEWLQRAAKDGIPTTKKHDIRVTWVEERTYIPDFVLTDRRPPVVIEFKGRMTPDDAKKIRHLMQWCRDNDHQMAVLRKRKQSDNDFVDVPRSEWETKEAKAGIELIDIHQVISGCL